jgi:hypothetical protein
VRRPEFSRRPRCLGAGRLTTFARTRCRPARSCAACPTLQEQFAAEKEDLLDDYRQLTREIKLKNLIIACFIPPEYQDQIMRHCHFDDYDQSWAIECIECAGGGRGSTWGWPVDEGHGWG